ncbi:TonB-dependent receptor, partial [Pandoraea nosoerga]|nr:TonB-dependent receptor [Pandoraea nosoerga]
VGLLFNPRWYKWTEPFSLSVDYFNIDIDNVIDALLEQTSLDHCYGAAATSFQPGSVFCSNVQRIASGPDVGALYAVNRTNANLARRQTAGVDVQASYNLALNDLPYLSSSSWQLGSLLNSLVYTYLDKFDLTPFQGAGHD